MNGRTRRRCAGDRAMIVALATICAVACGGVSPSSPSNAALRLSFPDAPTARLVACDGCTEPPYTWMVLEFDVGITDLSGQGGVLATIEAVVRNVSRNTELGRNRRPNADVGIGDATLAPAATLRVPIGVVFDVPPPRDEVQVTVTVTLTDGRVGRGTTGVRGTS